MIPSHANSCRTLETVNGLGETIGGGCAEKPLRTVRSVRCRLQKRTSNGTVLVAGTGTEVAQLESLLPAVLSSVARKAA
jgi:hypothetical protein